ncbi:MAG: type II secretion system protein GspL [Granulosicoccus sp.]|nr:type II secretion system protein GspL [Granulosicoccus sp.]
MAKNYIIHVPTVGEDLAHWVLASDSGALASTPKTGTLAEAASAVDGRRSIVVLPGDDVLLAEANIPGGSLSRAQQAAPYVLEEQVADDVDTLHFALGSKTSSGNYPVAVINREDMDTLREQFQAAGLRPSEVVPETLALPKFDNSPEGPIWTALLDQDHTVVRLNGYKGFAADPETAELMLYGARQELEEHQSGSLVLFRTDGHDVNPKLPDLEIETRPCESRLDLFAKGLAHSPRINLLQGDYSLRQQFDKAWKPWRWTIALAVLLAGILSSSFWFEYRDLGNQVDQINAQTNNIFQRTFPGSKARRPRATMASHLRTLASGGTKSTGFITVMDQISAATASIKGSKINSLNFKDSGRINIDMDLPTLPAVDQLKNAIEKAGLLTMTVEGTNRIEGGVRARLRLELK